MLSSSLPSTAWWDPALYPFESRFLDLPGGRVHYIDEGSGPVILFLPPAPLWSFMYRRVIMELRDRFRCVAMDFPGFGPSLAPPSFQPTLDSMSAIVTQLIDALDLRGIILFGHDSGGLIGLHAAGRHPERFAGLVLANTIGFSLGWFSPIRLMLKLVTSYLAVHLQERWNMLARAITRLGVRQRKPSPGERTAYLLAYPDAATRRRPLEVFRQMSHGDDFFQETERGLARLRELPVLGIYGQFDPVRLLGYRRRFAAVFPRHHGVLIRGEAHFTPEGAPEEIVAAVREWWNREFHRK